MKLIEVVSLTPEEFDQLSDEEIENIEADIGQLPFWTRARYFKRNIMELNLVTHPEKQNVQLTFKDTLWTIRAEIVPVIEEIIRDTPLDKVRQTLWYYSEQGFVILDRD